MDSLGTYGFLHLSENGVSRRTVFDSDNGNDFLSESSDNLKSGQTETIRARYYRWTGFGAHSKSEVLVSVVQRKVRQVRSYQDMRSDQKREMFLVCLDLSRKPPLVQVLDLSSGHLYKEQMRIHKAINILAMYYFIMDRTPYIFIIKFSKKRGVKVTKLDVIRDKEKCNCRKPTSRLIHNRHIDVADGILFLGGGVDFISKYNVYTNKWTTIKLAKPSREPFVTKHNDKVYMFERDSVQILCPLKERVSLCELSSPFNGLCAISCPNGIVIPNGDQRIVYKPEDNECITACNKTFHATMVHATYTDDKYYALVTTSNKKVELWTSVDSETWSVSRSFHLSGIQIIPSVFVKYPDKCPVVPFIDYENQLRKCQYS